MLLQFCNGATGFSGQLGEAFEREYLLPAGEIVWHAGPRIKLPSLCQGAAGSGYALLALFEATGDQVWLDRARAFAMHAIAANQRFIEEHGQSGVSDAGLLLTEPQLIRRYQV